MTCYTFATCGIFIALLEAELCNRIEIQLSTYFSNNTWPSFSSNVYSAPVLVVDWSLILDCVFSLQFRWWPQRLWWWRRWRRWSWLWWWWWLWGWWWLWRWWWAESGPSPPSHRSTIHSLRWKFAKWRCARGCTENLWQHGRKYQVVLTDKLSCQWSGTILIVTITN